MCVNELVFLDIQLLVKGHLSFKKATETVLGIEAAVENVQAIQSVSFNICSEAIISEGVTVNQLSMKKLSAETTPQH